MKHYYATECIFDLIAACGPQELYAIHAECSTQCTEPAFAECLTIGAHHYASLVALDTLSKAGIIGWDGEAYDLTDYGYALIEGTKHRHLEYEAHRRTTLG